MAAADFFSSNWAYLEAEFSWLERRLMLSAAQQRKNLRAVNRAAKTAGDRATSSWWQGLVAVPSRDSKRLRSSSQPSSGRQQTLAERVRRSQDRGVCLALPTLQRALDLSPFEKSLVLMALAPEYRTRYGRLYHYLQTGRDCPSGALPTLELALRLLCRHEREQRQGRERLGAAGTLRSHQILLPLQPPGATLLGSPLQLSPPWVEYLLAEKPDPNWPYRQLHLADQAPTAEWDQVILPPDIKSTLQTALLDRARPTLLVGSPGTGKTLAARAAAAQLGYPLRIVDLRHIEPQKWLETPQQLSRYPVVLVKAAHRWLGKDVEPEVAAAVRRWLDGSSQRLWFSTGYRHLVRPSWRRQLTVVDLPAPGAEERLQLWHQAFPEGVKFMGPARWQALATGLPLSGAEIYQLATAVRQLATGDPITLEHLQQALANRWQLR